MVHQSVKQTQPAMTSATIVLLRIFLRRICSMSELMPANEFPTTFTLPRADVKRARWFSSDDLVSSACLWKAKRSEPRQ
jgi:hypothetical protein